MMPRPSLLAMPDMTAPYGYDELGNPIETVTVTASRLPDWMLIGGFAVLMLLAFSK